MIAACIVCYWQSGPAGGKQLLKKAIDTKKITNRRWYLPILGLMPLIGLISYALLRLSGAPLPIPVTIPILPALVLVMSNLSWSLFPNYGSHYNPAITAVFTWLAVIGVVFGWGASTLARFRFARPAQAAGI